MVLGTDLPALGCLLPGKGPKSKGQIQIFTPAGEVRATELCPTPGGERSCLPNDAEQDGKTPQHHGLEQAVMPAAGIQVIQGQHPPWKSPIQEEQGHDAAPPSALRSRTPRTPPWWGRRWRRAPRCPLRRAEGETARASRRTSKARGVSKPRSVLSHLTGGHGVFWAQGSPCGALALSEQPLKDS